MSKILVDIDFIIHLREKYAMMRNLPDEDRQILDYCENLINNFHCNRAMRTAYQNADYDTYNGIKQYKEGTSWRIKHR